MLAIATFVVTRVYLCFMVKIEQAINQSRFESDYHKMIVNLVYTSNWLRDQQMAIFRPHGLLPQHFNVLRILKGRDPEPCSAGEIKEVMLDKAPDLTRLVDKLVKKGLVNRRLCEENRRRMEIFISEAGKQLLRQLNKEMEAFNQQYRNRMSEPEAAELSRLLDRMRG